MRGFRAVAVIAALTASLLPVAAGEVDTGVIRLADPSGASNPADASDPTLPDQLASGRRGFDFGAFDSRIDALWFQRKALLAERRDVEGRQTADRIRAVLAEEGVGRLEAYASALLVEARRFRDEGSHEKALAALALAESLDPGRPQIALARADVLWKSGEAATASARQALTALSGAARAPFQDPLLWQPSAVIALAAVLASLAAFALLMAIRYHVPFRHEVEEWIASHGGEVLAPAAAWAILLLPAIVWVGVGWIALWWLALTFRFMRIGERAATVTLLIVAILALPAYRVAVGLHGLAVDPIVRTTLAAASGNYDPEQVVHLRELVAAHPSSPVYRFLLAGMYKNGRYLEEAYEEYKRVLDVEPDTWQARVNIGNIFFVMGQHGEAIAQYKKAIESRPTSALAHYNLYLAQNESFRLADAKQTLDTARSLAPDEIDQLLTRTRDARDRALAADAAFDYGAILRATIDGRTLGSWLEAPSETSPTWSLLRPAVSSPFAVGALLALVLSIALAALPGREGVARACVRCGRPFCARCKAGRDHADYCSQCVHLFVLGDGLAPETKTRKLWEVERHDRRERWTRRVASTLVPGSAHLLRGSVIPGLALLVLWSTSILAWSPGWVAPVARWTGCGPEIGNSLARFSVPAGNPIDSFAVLALPCLILAWLAGNAWVRRPKEA